MRERKTPGQEESATEAATEAPSQRLLQLAARRRAVQRKATGTARPTKIPQGGGDPLGEGVRRQMEGHLGADLSGVKIHTGSESAQAASSLSARAFTVGSDVHFNAGEFAPESPAGQKLLAHELTHVVQGQTSGVHRQVDEEAAQEEPAVEGDAGGAVGEALEAAVAAGEEGEGEEELDVSSPGDPAEVEADAMAESLDGGEAGAISEEAPGIGRKSETDPLHLGKPAPKKPAAKKPGAKKPAAGKKADPLEKRKEELIALLDSIKGIPDLPRVEPQLQAFEKEDPVLAKMVREYRLKLGGSAAPRDLKIPPPGADSTPPGVKPDSPLAPKPPEVPESIADKLAKPPKEPSEKAHPPRPNNAPDAPVNMPGTKKVSSPGIPLDAPKKEKSDAVHLDAAPEKKGEKKPEPKKPPEQEEKKKELGLFDKIGKALQAINDLIMPKHRDEPKEDEPHFHEPSDDERMAEAWDGPVKVGKAWDLVVKDLKGVAPWEGLSDDQRWKAREAFRAGPDAFHSYIYELAETYRIIVEGGDLPGPEAGGSPRI